MSASINLPFKKNFDQRKLIHQTLMKNIRNMDISGGEKMFFAFSSFGVYRVFFTESSSGRISFLLFTSWVENIRRKTHDYYNGSRKVKMKKCLGIQTKASKLVGRFSTCWATTTTTDVKLLGCQQLRQF